MLMSVGPKGLVAWYSLRIVAKERIRCAREIGIRRGTLVTKCSGLARGRRGLGNVSYHEMDNHLVRFTDLEVLSPSAPTSSELRRRLNLPSARQRAPEEYRSPEPAICLGGSSVAVRCSDSSRARLVSSA